MVARRKERRRKRASPPKVGQSASGRLGSNRRKVWNCHGSSSCGALCNMQSYCICCRFSSRFFSSSGQFFPAGHCALWQGAAHRRDVEKMHRGAECISIPSYGRPPQGAKAKKGIAAESRPIGKRPAWFQSPKGLELSREFLLWCAVQYAIIYYIAYAAGFQAGFFHLPANCNGFLWERI